MPTVLTTPAGPQLVKLCSGMVEAGKAYVSTSRLFVSGVRDLSQQCQGDTVISVRGQLTSDLKVGYGERPREAAPQGHPGQEQAGVFTAQGAQRA